MRRPSCEKPKKTKRGQKVLRWFDWLQNHMHRYEIITSNTFAFRQGPLEKLCADGPSGLQSESGCKNARDVVEMQIYQCGLYTKQCLQMRQQQMRAERNWSDEPHHSAADITESS